MTVVVGSQHAGLRSKPLGFALPASIIAAEKNSYETGDITRYPPRFLIKRDWNQTSSCRLSSHGQCKSK